MKLLMHKIYKWLLVLMLLIQSVPNYSSLHVHAEEEHDHEHEGTQQVVEIDEKDYLDDGVFRLLLIGNSFSQDASNSGQTQLLDILKAMLPEGTKIEIGHYTSGGKTVAWYASRARNDEAFCSLSMITSDTGKWKGVLGKSTISTVLEYKDWDVVTIQPHGTETTKGAFDNSNTEEYHADLDMLDLSVSMPYMLDYIHEYAPQSDVYYYLSWATSGVAKYDTNGSVYNTMLDNVRKVQNYSGENKSISGVIPVGTAVQTARTSYLAYLQYNTDKGTSLAEDKNIGLTRDGWHVSYNIGRYIAALTFAETLIPESMRKDSYTLPSISDSQAIGKLPDEYTEIAQLCVNKAIESINYDADKQYAYTKLTEYQTDPAVTAAETVSKTEFVLNRIKTEEDLISALKDEIKNLVHDEIEINIELKNEFEPSADTFDAEVSLRFGYTTKTVEVSGTVKGELEGKKLSVLGASISTFAGTSNGDASKTTNSTIKNNAKYYPNTTIPEITLNDTWWMQVCEDLNLELLVNNSWSGSAILLERSGTVGAYVDRCVQLHDNTGDNAGEEPDIIIIQMGFNDFSYGKATLGDANINYEELITANGYGEPKTTMEATVIMLDKMTKRYPDAEIYMFNHFKRVNQSSSETTLMETLNNSIKTVCDKYGVNVVDLYSTLTSDDYIGDGRVHPNKLGMDVITETVKKTLVSETGYELETHTVEVELKNVNSDYWNQKIVVDGDQFELNLSALNKDDLSVQVIMGNQDVTSQVYQNGCVSIEQVTDNVSIVAEAVHQPQHYRWTLTETELSSEENPLTLLSGTIENKQFTNVAYELDTSVVLNHDELWTIEWKSSGSMNNEGSSTGARIFTSTEINSEYNARYIFKSSVNGLITMGEKRTDGSHNYGLELADYGIDGSAEHVYKLENRIHQDGSNMIYLSVDGKEVGALDHYYIGTKDQNTESDWLSGKDFVFSYMGTDTHGFSNCSIEYIEVWENGKPAEQMTIRYDDHLDMTGKTVQIIDAGTPTSYQVGYGVEENTVLDSAVVTLVDNTLIATGIGSAKVSVDDVVYEITVETAPISLILLIGQSNMRGSEGDADQSIVCPDGMVYATFGDDRGDTEGIMNAKNATKFAASALTGQYSTINVEGTTEHLSYYPLNSLTEDGKGTIGPDSGFAYEWVKQTGEKVWIVNAAHGGTSITTWVENATNFKEADLLFSACQETLRKEIAAGHFSLSHMGYYWCQGCSDAGWTAEKYATTYLSMHESLKKNLTFDDDSNPATPDAELEFAGIIPVRAGNASSICYREGTYEVTTTAKYHESFKDLRMTGPRVAQYWMTNNPELEDIWLVCNIGEDWVTMPDGTNGVSSYFQKHYANGTVDYTPQVAQKTSWYTPTTPAAVHDSIHYNQIGYNEIGRESVRNTMVYLGINEPEETETTVEFVSWDGFSTISEMKAYKNPASGSLVVPMVSPVYKSKEVTYALSEGLSYAYYDLLTESVLTTGALTASNGKTLSIKEKALSSYHWNLVDDAFVSATIYGDTENPLTLKSGSIENGTFSSVYYLLEDSVVLKHDKQWVIEWKIDGSKTNASGATLLSAAASTKDQEAYLYVRPNNSFVGVGYNNGTNGVNFGYSLLDYGYDVTDKHTYRLVNRVEDDGSNMIYLFVDGKEVGPLNREHKGSTQYIGESSWVSGQDFVFSYLGSSDYPVNGMTLNYLVVSENDTDDTVHFHNYTEWTELTAPSKEGPAVHTRICDGCGNTETREVDGVWQKFALADHLNEMPEYYCSETNLWDVLEHDPKYFTNGTTWTTYSSGNTYKVPSITIPIEEGAMVFATSFGKAGENGHATSNGIRMTWFDDYGVIKTMGTSETYKEFAANGGYLVAPEGAKYINIPMWETESSDNEVYILNREHQYTEWTRIPDPLNEDELIEYRKCNACNLEETREIVYTDKELYDAFVVYMNKKAQQLGMVNTTFVDPAGIGNFTTAEDIFKLMLHAQNYEGLTDYWGKSSYTVALGGPKARNKTVQATYFKYDLDDYYEILGGKTGTLAPYNARNLAIYLAIPDSTDKLLVVMLSAVGTDGNAQDRYKTVRAIADYVLSGSNEEFDATCKSAIAARVKADGSYEILYQKNTLEKLVPASISKVMTAICALDLLEDKTAVLTYKQSDIDRIGTHYTNDFYVDDTISFEEAIPALILPSSNITAAMIGRSAGTELLKDCAKVGHKYTSVVTESTCAEDGYTTYTCSICGDSYVDNVVEATQDHSFNQWHVIVEPTYEKDGEESRECTKCSHVEFRSVSLEVISTGNFGYGTTPTNKVIYTLYSDGTMVVEGTGRLFGNTWRGDDQPFYEVRNQIKTLIIGEGITQTTGGCFAYLINLEKVSFPLTLTHLNTNAFMGSFVSDVTEITIPETVTYLADYSFGNYMSSGTYFTDIIIENPNVTFKASNAVFNSGYKLDQLTLYSYGSENNVRAYAEEYGIRYVDLNDYISGEINGLHYEYSNGELLLTPVSDTAVIPTVNQPWSEFKDDVTKIVISSGITEIPANAFVDYTALMEVEVPIDFKTIGNGAFAVTEGNSTKLTMTLPRRMTSVGEEIFEGRTNVQILTYYGSAAAEIDEPGVQLTIKKVFNLLLIGNSYSEDASNGTHTTGSQLFDILKSMLGEDAEITVGLLASGGKGMHWHATQAYYGNASGSLKLISTSNPTWKSQGSMTSAKALSMIDWDAVSLQPYDVNVSIGQESVPYPDTTNEMFYSFEVASEYMLDHVKKHAHQADVYLYMHWARTKAVTLNAALSSYNKMANYFPVVLDFEGTETGAKFETIIPVGQAVQNARSTYLALLSYNTSAYDDKNLNLTTDAQIGLQRDPGHLSFNIGRYLAALTFAEMVIPEDMRVERYTIPDIRVTESVGKLPKEYTTLVQMAVNNAISSWKQGSLAVAPIEGYETDPAVEAEKTLSLMNIETCGNDESAKISQITEVVKNTLHEDFVIEEVTLNSDSTKATVTIRYGYTTVTAEMTITVVEHTYVDGICSVCGDVYSVIPSGWTAVPLSRTENSSHLAYQIVDGVLTFRDFGDASDEDYGIFAGYTNNNNATSFEIPEWYQNNEGIKKVVFDESISFIGSFVLTNMNSIEEIHIENENAEVSVNMILFSTTNREEALSLYAASTLKTVDTWIRGHNNRKISKAVSSVTMYYTNYESQLKELEDILMNSESVSVEDLNRAYSLLNNIPDHKYNLSDYQVKIEGSETLQRLLSELTSGSCGNNVTYQMNGMEGNQLHLVLSGSGDVTSSPWQPLMESISDVTISDLITGLDDCALPEDAVYRVYLNSEAYDYAKEHGLDVELEALRVLSIGNSHTNNYSTYLTTILKDLQEAGLETKVTFAKSVTGSIGLYSGRNSNVNATYRSHLEGLNSQASAYNSLKNNRYDLIVVQDYMESIADAPEVFAEGLASFIKKVREIVTENGNGNPEIAWFADWVDIRTTGGDNSLYDGQGNKIKLESLTREEVYAKSLANVAHIEEAIRQNKADMPDFVIHASTIKQNAMSSYLGTSTLYENTKYSLIESDNTHLTSELGCYLMGAGVVSEIMTHYQSVLNFSSTAFKTADVLTLANTPKSKGSNSQTMGSFNAEILDIVRESISSPNQFKQSVYVNDPAHLFAQQFAEITWSFEGLTTQEAILAAVENQIPQAMKDMIDSYTIELVNYESENDFTIKVQITSGYTMLDKEAAYHKCDYQSDVTAPTCTEQGYTTYTCTRGDHSYVSDHVEALGHEEVTDEAVDATCTETGLTEGKHCERCGEVLVEQTVTDKLGHDYESVITEPTCTTGGFTTHTCERCDDTYTDAVTDKLGHNYTTIVTTPTCEEAGYTTYTCVRCDDSYVDDHTNALGHNYGIVVTAPNCISQGYTTYTCVQCSHSYQDHFVDSTGEHDYVSGTCTGCGHSVLGNDWIAPEFVDGDYSMVVVPDPQRLVNYHPEAYYDMMQWIVDNEKTLNIQAVLNMGDMTDTGAAEQWVVSKKGMDLLNSTDIAWMPMMGNHDDSAGFNSTYDYATYGSGRSWFGGSYQSGKLDHTYWFVDAGDRDYLVFSLGWMPTVSVLSWAEGILQQHPDKNVIVTVHAYMNSNGALLSKADFGIAGLFPQIPDGQQIWDTFKKYENVVLMMSGHVHSEDIVSYVDQNAANKDVASLLLDRQNDDTEQKLGTLAIFTFHEDSDTVEVNWYSTKYDAFYREKNQLTITVPHTHKCEYETETFEATCTEGAGTIYTCTLCGKSHVEYESEALGHKEVIDAAVDATCTETGLTEGKHCERCDEVLVEQTLIDQLGHQYESVVTDPTCTTGGYTTHTCERCDDTYTDAETDKLGHEYTSVVTEATCEEAGYTTYTCTRGDDSYVSDHVDALGHAEVLDAAEDATCTETGLTEGKHCGRCGEVLVEQKVTDKLGHDYAEVVVDPTCTESGYTKHTCTRCDDVYEDAYVTELGHHFGEWFVSVESTYETAGEERRDCERCDAFETRELPVKQHSYTSVVVDPTCTEAGYTLYTCTECGNSYQDNAVKALGHSYGSWTIVVDATHDAKGTERRDCVRCDEFETREIAVKEHVYSSTIIAPTCTTEGYTVHTCECGDSYNDTYVSTLSHYFGEFSDVVEADCFNGGTKVHVCETCGFEELVQVEPLGHKLNAEVTAPSCTEAGYTTYTCQRCGYSYTDDATEPAGHDFGEWIVVIEADCVTRGMEMSDCQVCEHYETRYSDALGHDYESVVTAPDCRNEGYTTHTCTRCSDSYVDSYVESSDHGYGQWLTVTEATCTTEGLEKRICTGCGREETRTIEINDNHKEVVDEAVDASCTESGLTEGSHCERCGEVLVEQTAIDKLGHDYESVVTEATCTEKGYTTHTCTRCSDSYVDQYTDKAEHDYGLWFVEVEPTLTTQGVERRDCENCEHFERRILPATQHEYTAEVIAPTCTDVGYTVYTCTKCNDTYRDHIVDALGHELDQWVVIEEGECTKTGIERRDCVRCDHYEIRSTEAPGHDNKETVIEPTCTQMGYTIYECQNCKAKYEGDYVEALGHTFGEWYILGNSTCGEKGAERRDCEICDGFETREAAVLEHTYEEVVVDATCTEAGKIIYTCSRCNDTYTEQQSEPAGHSFGEWKVKSEATCTQDGTETRICEICDETEERTLKAKGHKYVDKGTAATCTENGVKKEVCERCSDAKEEVTVQKLGHSLAKKTATATCTQGGYELTYCQRCDYSKKTNETSALGHSFGPYVSDNNATADKDGTKTSKCTTCGSKDTVIEPGTMKVISNYMLNLDDDALTVEMNGSIDRSKLHLIVNYTDGTSEEITDYELSDLDASAAGKRDVSITYRDYSDVLEINVIEADDAEDTPESPSDNSSSDTGEPPVWAAIPLLGGLLGIVLLVAKKLFLKK